MARLSGFAAVTALVVLAPTSPIRAQADDVRGTMRVGPTTITLASGMAVSYPAAQGPLVSVLLSDKPADREAFATDTRTGAGEPLAPAVFEGAWKSQHFGKRLSGIAFSVGENATLVSDEFLVGGRNNTFSLTSSEYVIEVTSTSPRLVGRIRTRTPLVDAGTIQAGLDATFDLPVETVGSSR